MKSNLNGRVDIKTPNTSQLFQMYDKIPAHQCSSFRNPTEGLWDQTTLSVAFFSQQNINIIQNGIRAGVYKLSNGQYTIGPQDCDALKIIMRSIFLQFSKNQEHDITGQIVELNDKVINYAVTQVLGEAEGYIKYMRDINTPLIPIARPILAYTNDKTLEFKRWFDPVH